jgi:hypothetical protein
MFQRVLDEPVYRGATIAVEYEASFFAAKERPRIREIPRLAKVWGVRIHQFGFHGLAAPHKRSHIGYNFTTTVNTQDLTMPC